MIAWEASNADFTVMDDLKLSHAQTAADDSSETHCEIRGRVFALLENLLLKRSENLCKEYCYQKRYEFICTVDARWGSQSDAAVLCEWGNATYVWILDDLFKKNRLRLLSSQSDDAIVRYFSKVLHSHIFKERFKDWRFQRRVRVPEYIKKLDPDAQKIYWRLCDRDLDQNIAQMLGRPLKQVQRIVRKINQELHKRNKLHLLNLNSVLSLSGILKEQDNEQSGYQWELSVRDLEPEEKERRERVVQAYGRLNWKEQYIVDAMVIEGLKAKSVLAALMSMGLTLDENIPINSWNEQKLYYFLRKTLSKLEKLSGINSKS